MPTLASACHSRAPRGPDPSPLWGATWGTTEKLGWVRRGEEADGLGAGPQAAAPTSVPSCCLSGPGALPGVLGPDAWMTNLTTVGLSP